MADVMLCEKLGVENWSSADTPPGLVNSVPWFKDDVKALKEFTKGITAPHPSS